MKIFLSLLMAGLAQSAIADEKGQAIRIHNRLTCEPPTDAVLEQMTDLIKIGKSEEAANLAIQNRGFLECTVKQWCAIQTNADRKFDVKLNDYCATVIGAVRDDKPFGDLLSADIIYVADPDPSKYLGKGPLPAYDPANNAQYEFLETKGLNLADVLVEKKQSEVSGVAQTSGLLTTRAFGEAYLTAGTNRRAVRYSMLNFLCNDLEQMSDTSRPDAMVGRDVERDPGGDATTYNNRCKGCHAGQDFFRGAWAFYDFDETAKKIKYTPGIVAGKYNINGDSFPTGYQTTDDRWMNNWTVGQNARFGWPEDLKGGNGVASFGKMLAKTAGFNTCMAKSTYKTVCASEGESEREKKIISELADDFKVSNQNLKTLFVKTALRCQIGE